MIRKLLLNKVFQTQNFLELIPGVKAKNSTKTRQIHSTYILLKSKSKKFEKKSKAPSVTDLDISSEILDKIGISSLGDDATESIDKMNQILRKRIAIKITPAHLDTVQIESKTGFVPLKLVSQLSFPKPNLIRLDMSQSREHLQNAVKALKHYFPFAGIQTQGFDHIEITTYKLNKVIKVEMQREAKKCCEDTKSIIRNISAPVLKRLKSQKSLGQDTKHDGELFIQSLTRYYSQQIDESVEKKLEEVDEL
ncbi:Ribosome recycling factor [Oopsacas minuta]|uniref:Ribosome-recycling factor, mitochondrial n=1 Tax=Oopsacas minuta TaxID=111878 RepID=A0AAV7JCF8_9METZ|nr:Ribosome recycling factor [Oopsacas minuta]